jgi:hypothetical protein
MPPGRHSTSAPPTDDATTQLDGREAQAVAGRQRQARDDAAEQRCAAGRASGAKRKAAAMSKEEAKAKEAAHKREVRAMAKATPEAAAGAADPAATVAPTSSPVDTSTDSITSPASHRDLTPSEPPPPPLPPLPPLLDGLYESGMALPLRISSREYRMLLQSKLSTNELRTRLQVYDMHLSAATADTRLRAICDALRYALLWRDVTCGKCWDIKRIPNDFGWGCQCKWPSSLCERHVMDWDPITPHPDQPPPRPPSQNPGHTKNPGIYIEVAHDVTTESTHGSYTSVDPFRPSGSVAELVLHPSLTPRWDRPQRISLDPVGGLAIHRHTLRRAPTMVERQPDPTVWLNDDWWSDRKQLLSPKHAIVSWDERCRTWVLWDGHPGNPSTSGTAVDDVLVPLGGNASLASGSEITFGVPHLLAPHTTADSEPGEFVYTLVVHSDPPATIADGVPQYIHSTPCLCRTRGGFADFSGCYPITRQDVLDLRRVNRAPASIECAARRLDPSDRFPPRAAFATFDDWWDAVMKEVSE